jgi:hypothetical protein
MAIKIPGTLTPSNPAEFKVVDAKHVKYDDRPVEQSDEGSLFKIVKEMYDTINATPVLDFVEGGNTSFCTAKTEELGNTIYLPVYVNTRAPGYCTYVIEKVKLSSFETATLSSLAEIEAKVAAREIDTEIVSQVKDLPGARSLNAGRASTTGEFLFRVTVTDGNNRPAEFSRVDDGSYGKAYTAAAIYYRITCGSLQLRSTFTTTAAKTIFSYDSTTGEYVNTKLNAADTNYKLLEFPAEVTSPLAGQIWLRYHLSYLNNTIAVGRPDTTSGWQYVAWGDPVAAGGSLQSKTTPVYLSDLVFKYNNKITSGQYNLYVEAVLTNSLLTAPSDPTSNYLQVSTGTNYTLDVLPNNTIAISSLETRETLFNNKTSNHYIAIPLVAKTNTTAQSLDNLETVGVLYNRAGGGKVVERLVSVFCSHGREFSWDLGTLPAGEYSIEVYCFINNRGASITTEEALKTLLTALNVPNPAYTYGSWLSGDFSIEQASGEGAFYVGQRETDEYRSQLLFSFTPKTGVAGVRALVDDTKKYQLTFNEDISWDKDTVDGQDLGALTLKRDQFGYLQELKDNGNTIIDGCADLWKILYDRDPETLEYLHNGFTLEAYFNSECIGLLNSHVVSMTYPRTELNASGANQGLYISYDKAEISDGSKQITYPLLEGTWQHLVFTVDREIKEQAGDFNGVNLEIADINPLPTLRVYLNGTLVQVSKLADDAFGAGKNPAFPFLINAACTESPNATNTNINLVTGEGLINRGACKLNTLRAYSVALRPTQVYNNYLYSVSPAQKAESIEKNNSILPKIYFVKNTVQDEKAQLRKQWYAQKGLYNSTFKILHGITQKKTEGNTPGSKEYLVNCTMYYKHTIVDDSQTPVAYTDVWTKFPDVDVFLQGTSSLEYPVKNYKIKVYDESSLKLTEKNGKVSVSRDKFKFIPPGQSGSTGWWTEDSVYTLKCDYMEHSHRNNTPTAGIFKDKVLDAVITACKKDPTTPNSDYYSPAYQVTKVDDKTGETYRPYRDSIDGFACGVYYCDADTSAPGTWTESGDFGTYTPAGETFTGSFMFNVDKEGSQLGFEIKGQEYEDIKCISYEGGTNNNSSAAAFVPLKYSYLEYVKNAFNLAPANYVPIEISGENLKYYRYDQSLTGPNATEDAKSDTLYAKAPATGIESSLLSKITSKGATIRKAKGSGIKIESKAEFESAASEASKLYLDYNDYVNATFSSFKPEYRKFRKRDLENAGNFINVYFAESQFGTFEPGTTPSDGQFTEQDSFGYLATQGYLEVYYKSGTDDSEVADLDNIDGVNRFSAGILSEKKYFDATLEPRFIFDEEDDDYYAPMKKAVQWVYENADNKDVFVRDFEKYFSFEYCMTYYLQMMLFAQVDNAGKNAMFDIWSEEGTAGENPFGIGKDQSAEAPLFGLGRLFPRPYDMDTQMGLDNSGADVKAPSIELNIALSPSGISGSDVGGAGVLGQAHKAVSSWKQSTVVLPTGTRYNSYNTSESKLWKSFGKYFNPEIRNVYKALRDQKIYDAAEICKYIDSKTYDVIGEKVYNNDAAIKYLSVQTNGLFDDKYYRCVQGNRRNRYETFLRQRIVFLDSVFEYSNSETYTALEVRSNAVQPTSVLGIQVYTPQYIKISVDSGKQAAIVTYVDPSYTYTYQGVTYPGVLFTLPTTGNDKNMVITGAGNIQAIRHLEHFYLNKCNISTATKLSEINLSGAEGLTELQLGNNRYLRHLDLRNTTELKTQISVAQCSNLESIDISNSGITGLVLPENANISSINCQNSGINTLSLKGLKFLTRDNLILDGCTNISTIELDDCPKMENIDFSIYDYLTKLTIRRCPGITEVDLSNLKNLATIELNDTVGSLKTVKMTNAAGSAFKQLNLAGCSGITYLDLSSTLCTDSTSKGAVIVVNNAEFSTLNLAGSSLGAFTTSASPTQGTYDFANITFTKNATLSFSYNTGIKVLQNLRYEGKLSSLFSYASKLETINNSTFTASSDYKSIDSMFTHCSALANMSNISWGLSKVTSASSLFYGCSSLTLNAEVKDALAQMPEVTSLSSALRSTKISGTLPVDLFKNNKKVTSLSWCFYGCGSINSIEYSASSSLLSPMAGTLKDMTAAFGSCGNLKNVPYNLFSPCTALTTLDRCFYSCTNLGNSTTNTNIMYHSGNGSTTYTRYFNQTLNASAIAVRSMFANCLYLKMTANALTSFYSQLGTKIKDTSFTFFRAGSSRTDTGPSIPQGLFANNTNLNFLDGTFALSYISGALPHSIFCNCNTCSTASNAQDAAKSCENNAISVYSARGLFAGCTKLSGRVSNAFFKRTPFIRLIGFVSRNDSKTPTDAELVSNSQREGNGELLNINVWTPSNIGIDSNSYLYTPGGMFANTAINSFDAEFLQPLTMLRDCSGLFAKLTPNDASAYVGKTTPLFKPAAGNSFTCRQNFGEHHRIPAALFAQNTKLADASYCFCGNKGWQGIEADLFANTSSLVTLAGAFMGCSDLTKIIVPDDYTGATISKLLENVTSIVSLNSLFADASNLEATFDEKLFANHTKLSDCSAMFFNVKKLAALDSVIPATLFNRCRTTLKDTSYMFAGCEELGARIDTGWVIINDPLQVDSKYKQTTATKLGTTVGSAKLTEALNVLEDKQKLDQLLAEAYEANPVLTKFQYLPEADATYRERFKAEFATSANVSTGTKDLDWYWRYKSEKDPNFGALYNYSFAYFLNQLVSGRVQVTLTDLTNAAIWSKKPGCANPNTTCVNHDQYKISTEIKKYMDNGILSYPKYRDTQHGYYLEAYYALNIAAEATTQLGLLSAVQFKTFLAPIDNLLLIDSSLQTRSQFERGQRIIETDGDSQIGLLAECLALEKVEYMFAGCRNLYGAIPADLFYNIKSQRNNTALKSLAGLFRGCHGLTLNNLDSDGFTANHPGEYPGIIAYRAYAEDGSYEVHRVPADNGGNYKSVYPAVTYEVTMDGDKLSWDAPSILESREYFVPSDWIIYVPNIADISYLFTNTGIMRDYANGTRYIISEVVDARLPGSECQYYSCLNFDQNTFNKQTGITTAEHAFSYIGTLGKTVLTNQFMSSCLTKLKNISYMFYCTKFKGFSTENVYSVFERSAKNTVLTKVAYAFCAAGFVRYFKLKAGSGTLPEGLGAASLSKYYPRFHDGKQFTKINSNSSDSTNVYSHSQNGSHANTALFYNSTLDVPAKMNQWAGYQDATFEYGTLGLTSYTWVNQFNLNPAPTGITIK